ncbi:MAG TPA: FecR domain-containing protein [Povalibacter sp.]|jgi:transmembrane sensor|nr:FecR domain-containing protein [Povalibacter sp.]
MSHTNADTQRSRAAHEAAEWLTVLAEEDSARQHDAFLAWLRASTLHVEEFLRLSALDHRLRRRSVWPDDSVDELVAAVRIPGVTSIHDARGTAAPAPAAALHPAPRWAAAIAAIALFAVPLYMLDRWHENEFGAMTYVTAVGEQRSITLPDGSVVDLNSRSRLRARYTEHDRQIDLSAGEAIFKVAKNPQRPFRVRVGNTEIVAVGTAFNVDAHEARTVVTVLEGRIRVLNLPETSAPNAGPPPEVEAGRGEQVVVTRNQAAPTVMQVDPVKAVAWTQRRLIFDNTPLAEVATEFARYHSRTIRVNSASLRDRRITGVFDANDPASLIEFLRTDHAINVETDDQGWRLSTPDLLIGTAATEKK